MAFTSTAGIRADDVRRWTGTRSYLSSARLGLSMSASPNNGAAPVRLEQNVAGDLFVNSACIDCDTCRALAPRTFGATSNHAVVHSQPKSANAKHHAFQALVSCPVGAIRTDDKRLQTQSEIRKASDALPRHISLDLPGVFLNGFNARSTFGASSYTLLLGFEASQGAILLDSPRFSEQLARQIEQLAGGPGMVKYMWISHRDDAGDHAKWNARLGCRRIIHENDVSIQAGTQKAETILQGEGPWRIDECSDIQILWVPGHSAGHLALVDRGKKVAFTGDHLAMSGRTGKLTGFPMYNSDSWERQIHSMTALAKEKWVWILPGHGRIHRFTDETQKDKEMQRFISDMLKEPI